MGTFILHFGDNGVPLPRSLQPQGGYSIKQQSVWAGIAHTARPATRYFLSHPQEHQEGRAGSAQAPQPQILACSGQRGGSEQRPGAVLPWAAPASKIHSTGKA